MPTSGGPTDYVQGSYRFYTVATDVADNVETTPGDADTISTETIEDSIAPSLSASHTADGSNGWNISDPVSVAVSASDGGSGLDGAPTCTVDGSPATVTGTSSPWHVSVSGEGTHAVHCSVSDKASNGQTANDTVKIDTVAPAIDLSHAANGGGLEQQLAVSVAIAVSDGGSGLPGAPTCDVDDSSAPVTGSASPSTSPSSARARTRSSAP